MLIRDLWNFKIDEIYIYTNDKNYLINSTYYKKNEKKIKIKWDDKIDFENIYSFRNYIFNEAKLSSKSVILFKRNKENNEIETYILYEEYNDEYFQGIMNMLILLIHLYNFMSGKKIKP